MSSSTHRQQRVQDLHASDYMLALSLSLIVSFSRSLSLSLVLQTFVYFHTDRIASVRAISRRGVVLQQRLPLAILVVITHVVTPTVGLNNTPTRSYNDLCLLFDRLAPGASMMTNYEFPVASTAVLAHERRTECSVLALYRELVSASWVSFTLHSLKRDRYTQVRQSKLERRKKEDIK